MLKQRSRHVLIVLSALVAWIGFTPTTASAGTAVHAQPFVPRAVSSTSGPAREVFGFALSSSLADPTVGYPSWNFSLLSTVAFFGLHVTDGGTFVPDSDWSVWSSSQLTGLVSTAHAHGTKVVLTIVLQDFNPGTPNMCAGLAHATTTAAAAVSEMKAKGVDGINIDYEGLNGSCGTSDPSWARHAMTSLAANVRSAMPAGSYLSVDTYASSASDQYGFFDVAAMAPWVDSFFVMAYDLEYSNYSSLPPGCSRFCLGPTGPLGYYHYNDITITAQYTSAVPASKVILGVPYYGRKACVSGGAPNAYPNGDVTADTYLDASQEASSSLVQPGSYIVHRDTIDGLGQERWDTWINTSLNCVRELYWDDTVSLANKYGLVNLKGLRGVGLWNLNYGGGAPELWSLLDTYFVCNVTVTLPATESTTQFSVGLSSASCDSSTFDVQVKDVTFNQGWFSLGHVKASANAATITAQGYRGHTYQFQVRAHSTGGAVGPWVTVSTQVSSTAALSHPFAAMYTLDAFGGVGSDDSPPVAVTAYWPGWKIVRAAHPQPGPNSPQSGFVLDGYGGMHPFGWINGVIGAQYWRGWDIARDFAFLPDGSGGYVLDGYGGLHPFAITGHAMPPAATGAAYFNGRDLARKVVIFSDASGGYVLDAFGGLHPFGVGGAAPANATGGAYWSGWKIARDLVLIPGTHAGYVLDGYGGLHPFNGAPALGKAMWSWDIARGVWLLPGSTLAAPSGYLLDGYGGLHPLGGAPATSSAAYWPGDDLALAVFGG